MFRQSYLLLASFFMLLFLDVAASGYILPVSAQILNTAHPVSPVAIQLSASEPALLEFGFLTILLPYLVAVIFLSSAADKYGRLKVIRLGLTISCMGYFFILVGTLIENVYLPLIGMSLQAIGSLYPSYSSLHCRFN